ncbi:MAG: BtpA/SgcQ family protein, partial [Candidatus Sumerlaeaceae bacterium]
MKGFDWSRKVMIGMVHLRALPGTPRASLTMREICATAVREAALLREAGFDAVLIENMHDVPYVRRNVGPEITAAVTAALCAVRQA